MKKAYLILENGDVFEGNSFGAKKNAIGHVVFNTNMLGYQEIITDPAYADCLVVITYPLIGACGINDIDYSSSEGAAKGLIIKEYSHTVDNWQATMSLEAFMKKRGIVGIDGIDTRYLTRYTVENGIQKGMITNTKGNIKSLLKKMQDFKQADMYKKVSCKKAYNWQAGKKNKKTALVLDYGVTYSLLNWIDEQGYQAKVFPASTSVDKILKEKADLIVISNGPGSPFEAKNDIERLAKIVGKKPIVAFGLGSCLLAAALGAKNEVLKSGHYGFNKAIKDIKTKKVQITQQEHRFVVNKDSLPKNTEILSLNLHDETLEAFSNKSLRASGYFYLPAKINI
jgi:carbamoyl-phosphate synthase small subunit